MYAVITPARLGQPRERPGAFAGKLGFQVPKRAIERIAGRARRQEGQQVGAGGAKGNGVSQGLDLGRDAVHGFAIARIGNALAAPGNAPLLDRGHDDASLGAAATRDRERARDRKAFDTDFEPPHTLARRCLAEWPGNPRRGGRRSWPSRSAMGSEAGSM